MKQTINKSQFMDAFSNMNRADNFSYDALELLFDYFEECESCGDEIELDVISICCEYAESSVSELISDYHIDIDGESDEAELIALVTEYLNENTILIGLTDENSFVYAQF